MTPVLTDSDLTAVRTLRDEGNYEEALAMLERHEWMRQGSLSAAYLARDCYMKMGEVSKALGAMNHAQDLSPGQSALRLEARHLLGRLIETDVEWSPKVPEGIESADRLDTRVLHLLKESLPYVETGYTMRSGMTLEAQRRGGFDPVVVTSLGFPRREGVATFPSSEDVLGVRHYRLDLGPEYPARMPFDLLLADQTRLIADLIPELRPSLIQAGSSYRGFDGALVGLSLARALDIPWIYEIRGFLEQTWTADVERSVQGEYFHRRRKQENRCLNAASLVITIADAMREEIVQRGVPESSVWVVPNAVDVDRFTPRPRQPDLVSSHRLEGRTVLGYISNLGWREGLPHLIEATKLLVDRGHDVACLIVGDGPERHRLESLVSAMELDGRVALTGHVANSSIEDYYALIDIFVVPRVNDRASRLVTPLKPLEAMAMGIPVVAADLPALREQVAPGERGLVFEPNSSTDLARVLDELLKDETARQAFSTSALKWVREERTLESNVSRYSKILNTLL